MNQPVIVGLDVGGTKTASLCGSMSGEILWKTEALTGAQRGFKPVFDQIVALAEEALSMASGNAVALSVSIGGPLDVLRGVINSPPNLPGWGS